MRPKQYFWITINVLNRNVWVTASRISNFKRVVIFVFLCARNNSWKEIKNSWKFRYFTMHLKQIWQWWRRMNQTNRKSQLSIQLMTIIWKNMEIKILLTEGNMANVKSISKFSCANHQLLLFVLFSLYINSFREIRDVIYTFECLIYDKSHL